MKPVFKQIVIVIISLFLLSCSSDEKNTDPVAPVTPAPITPTKPIGNTINYLALGDSYTIGQSVCETCRYPEQLKQTLNTLYVETSFSLKVIARTGWTTSDLISAINNQNPEANYDLVTLLIGVNNQYQGRNFSIYEKEFPELVTKAVALAKGDKKNVLVLSIPDYAYTPFGQNQMGSQGSKISAEIDQYNTFAKNYCKANDIIFIDITDITRNGLNNPELVASDGLHPSKIAYSSFVERILPSVKVALQD